MYVSAAEAEPGVAPDGAGDTATYTDSDGTPLATPSTDSTTPGEATPAIGPCTPYSGRDNPHRSSTGVAVSGHGWWDKGDCSSNTAHVYNCVYEYYTDNTWRRKACSVTKVLKPGGGSAQRTTARRNCANTLTTSWRNHVDVDVDGEWDTAEKPYRQADVACRIYN